jgi:hypothetical protein
VNGACVPPGTPAAIATPTVAGSTAGNALSPGAIAGIVIGVLVGVFLIAGLSFYYWSQHRATLNKMGNSMEMSAKN